MTGAALAAGLRLDPDASRHVFRCFLDALSRPGRVTALPAAILVAVGDPALLLPLVLADVDAPVAFDDAIADGVRRAVRDATGARPATLDTAPIAVLGAARPADVVRLPRGTALAPEHGAKAAIRVSGLAAVGAGPGPTLLVLHRGPGVPGMVRIAVTGLAADVIEARDEACSAFPAGIDIWLVAPDGRLAGIPRSCTVEIERGG